jgi:hypothetical protein
VGGIGDKTRWTKALGGAATVVYGKTPKPESPNSAPTMCSETPKIVNIGQHVAGLMVVYRIRSEKNDFGKRRTENPLNAFRSWAFHALPVIELDKRKFLSF